MQGMTHTELVGTITKPPDLRYTPAGLAILTPTIAGEDQPPGADRAFPWYHRVTVFGTFAETLADQLPAGTAVHATGRIETRTWDRPDGTTGHAVDVIATTLKVLDAPDLDDLEHDQAGQPRLRTGWNHAVAMGNLTRDANLHHTKAGRPVAKLRVAINERTPKGADRTTFLSARAWDDLATEAAHLTKGAPCIFAGRLVTESWTTRDGQARSETKLEAHRIDRVATPPAKPQHAPPPADDDEFPLEESLPF